MSQHYVFNESGSIPGVPGTFAGVRVDVADDGTLDVQPLPLHPHFEAEEGQTKEEEETPEEAPPPEPAQAPEVTPEQQTEKTTLPREEQAETEPEQPTSPPEASPSSGEANSEQA